ncbi:hypothetical protein [Rhizobium sp.]|uniref:hypothetical protein n=1 Tax=Rhizobium sp. TaxID=391 RepID=UPI002AA5E470
MPIEVLGFKLMINVACVMRPQTFERKRSMKHFAGLDVSVREISICIVDETGKICCDIMVVSYPNDLADVLIDACGNLVWVGLEAGPLMETVAVFCRRWSSRANKREINGVF